MPLTPKTDLLYCLRILEAIGKIELYAAGYDDPFLFFEANDQKDFNACLLLLLHIGEQINRISESIRVMYPQVAWQPIKGLRNLIAHDYVAVDRFVVFTVIQQQLPELSRQISHIIRTELQRGAFDDADYTLSKQSSYYRHIEFDKIA